jgi:hypothetical protein
VPAGSVAVQVPSAPVVVICRIAPAVTVIRAAGIVAPVPSVTTPEMVAGDCNKTSASSQGIMSSRSR